MSRCVSFFKHGGLFTAKVCITHFILFFLCFCQTAFTLTMYYGDKSNFVMEVPCNGPTPGWSKIAKTQNGAVNDYVTRADADELTNAINVINPGFNKTVLEFDEIDELTGGFNIHYMEALHSCGMVCYHGGAIEVSALETDPAADFDIKLFSVGYKKEGDKPLYYTDVQSGIFIGGDDELYLRVEEWMCHDEDLPWDGMYRGIILATVKDREVNGTEYYTVHEGFVWGWDGLCTPEPTTLLLLTGGIGILRLKKS